MGFVELPPITDPALNEGSGLARSRVNDGIWYTHNDSGGKPEIFAFNLEGQLLGIFTITGAEARDWEDMASGPCPKQQDDHCIYIGDIGDNKRQRENITLYAVKEPVRHLMEMGLKIQEPVPVFWHQDLVYPNGPKNAETLLVNPITGIISIVTKEANGESEIYNVIDDKLVFEKTLQFSGESKLEKLATGGEWSPDGQKVVIRTYSHAYIWSVPELFDKNPVKITLPEEQQGEAISFTSDNQLLTCSEGTPMVLHKTEF